MARDVVGEDPFTAISSPSRQPPTRRGEDPVLGPPGFWLLYKRLERGTFAWPEESDCGRRVEMRARDFYALLEGLDLASARAGAVGWTGCRSTRRRRSREIASSRRCTHAGEFRRHDAGRAPPRARSDARDAACARERARAGAGGSSHARSRRSRASSSRTTPRHRVEVFAQKMFGGSSEKLDPRQLRLAFEEAKAAVEVEERALEADALERRSARRRPRRPGRSVTRPRRSPPTPISPSRRSGSTRSRPSASAPAGGKTLSRIREEVSERLEYAPASTSSSARSAVCGARRCGEAGVDGERAGVRPPEELDRDAARRAHRGVEVRRPTSSTARSRSSSAPASTSRAPRSATAAAASPSAWPPSRTRSSPRSSRVESSTPTTRRSPT